MLRKAAFPWCVAALLAIRFWHFGAEIDTPHDWRQCDTAWYIRDFYLNGIDLLHPAVCWMGASDTLALEFPLPEALVALTYQVFGESIPLARFVLLCFFTGALYYFFRIVDLLFGRDTARLATLVYLALPLSVFYSRAVHIDFSVLFAAHAMLYYYLTGLQKRRWEYLLLSGLAAIFVAVVKAPYAFCLAPPMLFFAVREKALRWTLGYAWMYLPALGAFLLWQQHVNAVNGAAPDWSYILHYRKMTQQAHWYFGALNQRLSLYSWWILLQRGVLEVTGIGGMAFFLLGWRHLGQLPHYRFLLWWILGLAGYVLVFFNLNFVHNYYQIPLLAPAAMLCALGLQTAASGRQWRLNLLLGLLVAANIAYTEAAYFKVSADHVEIGRLIRENTPEQALVIVTYQNLDCRNPKILYRAKRRGWSVEAAALNPVVLERLRREEGAGYWAFAGADLSRLHLGAYADSLGRPLVFDLGSTPQKLYIFDLSAGK
ncbi:MAG: glycosyltransferase family 39 protein [Lewinellaceae bacterium]|nr:glycosyltransferase family 39 protein [Lewinellaceae bacterium]